MTTYHAEVENDATMEQIYNRSKSQIEAAQGEISMGKGFGNSPSILMVKLPSVPKVEPQNVLRGENLKFHVVHGVEVKVPPVDESAVSFDKDKEEKEGE